LAWERTPGVDFRRVEQARWARVWGKCLGSRFGGGGTGKGGSLAWKRRQREKWPRPPKWSAVKGRRAMLALLRARMMEELETELWVRPVSFDRMLRR
jgi:hypothetical protein